MTAVLRCNVEANRCKSIGLIIRLHRPLKCSSKRERSLLSFSIFENFAISGANNETLPKGFAGGRLTK